MLVRQKTYEENNAKLYIVGVPIGNYDDMSYRAVETLKNVDIIFCEDTRVTLKLLTYFNKLREITHNSYFPFIIYYFITNTYVDLDLYHNTYI